MDSSAPPLQLKRTFLYALIGSIALSALMGIVAILSGDFGWYELRILLTTVTVAAASVCGLACGACLAARAASFLPKAGIATTLPAAGLVIVGMWIEMEEDVYWKVTASLAVFAVALAHLSLLSMARLAPQFRWALIAAHVVILLVASLLTVMMLFEIDETGMFQLLGVAAIADASITITVPILHRLSPAHPTGAVEIGDTAGLSDSEGRNIGDRAAIDREIEQLKRRLAELEGLRSRL